MEIIENSKIKILILEHDSNDIELLERQLRKDEVSFVSEVVQEKEGYKNAIINFTPDIILSDFSFPDFNGLCAFEIKQKISPEIPFIFVSGTIDEENRINLINKGVTGFVLKNKMFTLTDNIIRGLRESKARKDRLSAEKKLIKSERRLKQAQAIAHVGSWELDFETGESLWSDEACRIYGLTAKENRHSFESWLSFIHPQDIDFIKRELKKAHESLSDFSAYHRIVQKNGVERYVHSQSKFEFDNTGKPIGLYGTVHDVTERKVAELKKEFDRCNMEALINNTNDLMWSTDRNFRLITSNQKFDNVVKLLTGKSIKRGGDILSIGFSEETLYRWKLYYERAFSGEIFTEIEHSGSPLDLWSEISFYPIREAGRIIGTACHSRDITEKKVAAENLIKAEGSVRNFATHLNQVLEDERAHIAREIHDEFGQQLAGMKISLSCLMKPGSKSIEEKVADMLKDTDNTMQALRKISTMLRPAILDSLGLVPSIEWLAKEFENKIGIKCVLVSNISEQQFEKNVSTCIFRICQEALTNISKHANATGVMIEVNLNKKELTLKISDNGKGISNEKLENPFSMGLIGMRERANIINAELSIISEKEVGTSIQMKVNID